MLEKILKKDRNEELEKILEEKKVDEQAKNLLQGMLYKIEVSYKDYQKVKSVNMNEKEYVDRLIQNIRKNCDSIKIIKLSEKVKSEKIQNELNNNKFYIKKREIISYPIEEKLLYAIEQLSNHSKLLNNKYGDVTIAVSDFINLGKDIDRVEVLRDFNGWSWTTIKKEIENIDANLVFQIFQLLLGKEFMDNWCQDKDGIIDFFEMMTSEFSEKYGNDRIEKLKEYLIRIAFANTIECNEEFKQELLEKISKLDCEIKQYEDTQNNIERITAHKKQNLEKIKDIEKTLGQESNLKVEYEKQDKIFNIKLLKKKLKDKKNQLLNEIEEDNYILNPKNYLAEKNKKINEKQELESKFLDKEQKEKLLIEFVKTFLECFRIKTKEAENQEEIIKLIYKFRYFMFLPFDLEKNIRNINEIKEEILETEKKIFEVAIQKKVISNMPFEIMNHVFETRIIILEELNYEIHKKKEKYYVQIFDENISEEKFEIIPTEKMKINKKTKIFI